MQKRSKKTIIRRFLNPSRLYLLRRSLLPLSPAFGLERGNPIDRYYIEKFLSENPKYIKGVCLEVEDNVYTKQFGKKIAESHIIDINKQNNKADIYADLRNMPEIKNNSFNCIILTQVLQFINDYSAAIKECHRILKPGGALLVSLPSISRIDKRAGVKDDFWRFTTASATYIFEKYFLKENIEIKSWGSVLSGLGFWIGMAKEEFSKKELDHYDPSFPVLISIRATK